jgi:hypothetical protein
MATYALGTTTTDICMKTSPTTLLWRFLEGEQTNKVKRIPGGSEFGSGGRDDAQDTQNFRVGWHYLHHLRFLGTTSNKNSPFTKCQMVANPLLFALQNLFSSQSPTSLSLFFAHTYRCTCFLF